LAIVLIGLSVVATHAPVLRARAISADDDSFVTNNRLVTNPGWGSARRFFVEVLSPSTVAGYYLPVSMTSLMLDYAAGGRTDRPRVFHQTSLALHVVVTWLVFLLLFRLLGSAIPATLAALTFGLHPLTVEPLAWISERKTLLAALFGVASMLGYVEYVRRKSRAWMATSVALFTLGLMSKPSVTSLPFLLLLLDHWPLKRLRLAAIAEKWPFFLVAAASGVIALLSLTKTDVIVTAPLPAFGWGLRIGYLLMFYLGKALWPVHLSVIYPPPNPFSLSNPLVIAPFAAACAFTATLFAVRTRAPGAWLGWLFMTLALAPTFGILAWSRIIAWDRYFYFPALGLVLALGWGLTALWERPSRARRLVIAASGSLVLIAEARAARMAQRPWMDSVALWGNAVAIAPGEPMAHNGLGTAYGRQASYEEAAHAFRHALEVAPDFLQSRRNLGTALVSLGRLDEANPHLRRAEALAPADPEIAYELGWAAHEAGKLDSAAAHYQRALKLKPDHVASVIELGIVRAQQGRTVEGLELLRRAATLAPAHPGARLGLAMTLLQSRGHDAEAIAALRQAVRLKPDWPAPLNTLAWLLATHPDPRLRNGEDAVRFANRVVELMGEREPGALDTRGAAEAAAGHFDRARASAARALELAVAAGDDSLADGIRRRIALYERGMAYTEPVKANF
jgi:tetratricopeptide (TPR) repeat protein